MLRTVTLAFGLVPVCAAGGAEVTVGSAHAIVVDELTGEVLLHKDELPAAPMASLTKLMTVMVVIDADQDLNEGLRIDEADRDRLKRTHGGVPVGAVVWRGALIELAMRGGAGILNSGMSGSSAALTPRHRRLPRGHSAQDCHHGSYQHADPAADGLIAKQQLERAGHGQGAARGGGL